jgi:tripartite-type tricarboxylate transporter receptor subunit TctC
MVSVPQSCAWVFAAGWAAAATILVFAPAHAADPVAAFYAGKTIKMLVGFGPGGGYDLYARTLARHMGRHIPGNPTLLPQNMPGAGSLRAANYLYNAVPRDGTVIATFARGIALEPLLGHPEGAQFEAPKFGWLGSISNEVGVCAFMATSGVATWRDMQTKNYTIGASGSGADSDIFPVLLRNLFRLPLKVVSGYPGGADLVLAMQRHEIDGRCGWSWTSLVSQNRALYESRQIDVVLQLALQKHEDLPDVPLVMDLAADAREKAALKLIVSRQSIARPFAAPPDVPDERLRALRAAFDATMIDPDFLADAKALDLEVRPVNGADVAALLAELYASPPEVVKLASDLIKDGTAP